jgi:hypothetical protein
MLMNNFVVIEELIKIHLILLNNHFQVHQMINKHVNEMDIFQDVIYI